ncbi:MAG: TIGR02302 family protein [Parvibaculum sp.]|nr:TIGR02302 family protein [Parvibaculum sp.]
MSDKTALKRTDLSHGTSQAPEGSRALPRRIEQRIWLARALLVWEYLWGGLWTALALTGLFIAAALIGTFEDLPLGIHWAAIASYTLFMASALWNGFKQFRWPSRAAALHHLEGASGLKHQPLSAYEDLPASGSGDPKLWAAHQAWVTERLKKLRLGTVAPGLVERDPYGLRAIVVLLLVIGIAGTGPGRIARITGAFFPGAGSARSFTIEAWITPPAYTGQRPIWLERGESTADDPDFKPVMSTETVKVPVGSVLSIRAHGLRNLPSLETGTNDRGRPQPLADLGNTNSMIDAPITSASELALTQGGRLLRNWSIDIIPDQIPKIDLAMPLQETASGSLHFAYTVSDDYGVRGAYARVILANSALGAAPAQAPITDAPPPPVNSSPALNEARKKLATLFRQPRANAIVKPPVIILPLKSPHPKDGKGDTYIDLTPHPWAGLPVIITLVATDDAGQEGLSSPIAINLPARTFRKPLAAATIEQRRALAFRPSSINRVARVLNNLTSDAPAYFEDKTAYLALRAAYWRMLSAKHDEDLNGIYELLWSVALRLEDGDLSLAESDLRRARDALAKALEQNASGDEVAQLVEEMKAAFERYMDAIIAKAGDNPDQAMIEQFAPQDGETIDRETLEKMLADIGNLANDGARNEARQLLEQMQAIMENLQMPEESEGLSEEDKAMAAAIEQLTGLIDKQRKLMDETFKAGPQGQGSEDGQGAGAKGKHSKSAKELELTQRRLTKELRALMQSLEDAGIEKSEGLGNSAKQMQSAEERLGAGRIDRATQSQGQAIQSMREAAQGMADKLTESMKGQKGQQSGKGKPGADKDPMGRAQQQGDPKGTKIPTGVDRLKARAIIEDLRRRAGELGRPQSELEYLDRLLNRF